MFQPQEGSTDELPPPPASSGPPWILGHRGAPREAPENTLVSLRRALDLGCDGVEYDLHGCATGEAVLIHDATLERTTDHAGPVGELTLPELNGVDAGGWFHKRFRGEPLPLLEEALELDATESGEPALHMIELKDPELVGPVARRVAELAPRIAVRLASFDRRVCLEARDQGLAAMLLAVEAEEDDRRFVRDEGIAAYGVGPGGWTAEQAALDWDCERWGWSVDDPDELYAACRRPLAGFNTNELQRALAIRALVTLAPDDDGPYPVRVAPLEVHPDGRTGGSHGQWSGRWEVVARVRNPLPFPVRAASAFLGRGGAFEVEGLPQVTDLAPGEETEVAFVLGGGSWSPGDDPVFLVRFGWGRGPGRPAGGLVLDADLHRVRTATLGRETLRLPMLQERPGDPEASMTIRRRGRELLCRVENPGGLEEPRALVRLGTQVRRGGVGVRVFLPDAFDEARAGLPFACGFEGRPRDDARARRTRRFGGGVPPGLAGGAPGLLFPAPPA